MSTTEYVLDVLQPDRHPSPAWLQHDDDAVRIRRVVPDCATVWEGEARELAREFVELRAGVERLRAQVALLEHQADCYWCEIAGGDWPRKHCEDCEKLNSELEAATH